MSPHSIRIACNNVHAMRFTIARIAATQRHTNPRQIDTRIVRIGCTLSSEARKMLRR